MGVEYYTEYFKKFADSSEEDAVKVSRGAVEMQIVDSIVTDINDRVAHQASVVLGFNMYKNDKDAYIQEICYDACTADCEIQKVVDKCKCIVYDEVSDAEDDITILCNLLARFDKKQTGDLGYICDELQRSYLVHDKPEYSQLSSNIDYILYDLLDVLDLNTDEGREYVYKHKEQFIRPIMDMVLVSGDIVLMEQMKQIYKNWMEWR
ncbi:MAG: hypothetical protein NC131_19040 [Roseburia sp.]|nr:hypothetical protein [Roseburia sp.]